MTSFCCRADKECGGVCAGGADTDGSGAGDAGGGRVCYSVPVDSS